MISPQHSYEVRPRADRRGVDLISEALPFGSYGRASLMQSLTQWATSNVSAGHIMPRSAFAIPASRNPRSARAMQDGVRLALLHFLQQLTDFQCGGRNNLDTAPLRLR